MNWIDIHPDEMPISGEPINIMEGLKVYLNYVLVWDNEINYHFESLETGHVIAQENVIYWCYC